jgi:hypothetical protein
MRPVPLMLMLAGLVLLGIVVNRIATGGPPGIKTYGAMALGLVLLIAGIAAMRRRPVVDTVGTTPPTVR